MSAPLHPDADAPAIRIGELARRAGIPPATLRAWERRYGIVAPQRTESGYRLYTAADERRLRAMVRLISEGLAPAEAAREALREASGAERRGSGGTDLGELREELLVRLAGFDEPGVHGVLDRALAGYGAEALVLDLVLPVLQRAGGLWSEGKLSVGQEHFGSQLLRARLLALARGWGGGSGPLVLLASPPGELHDIGLVAFGLIMRERGHRVALLGADTPLDSLALACGRLRPELAVLATTMRGPARKLGDAGSLEFGAPLAIAGRAATAGIAEKVGAELLPAEMSAAADRLAATV